MQTPYFPPQQEHGHSFANRRYPPPAMSSSDPSNRLPSGLTPSAPPPELFESRQNFYPTPTSASRIPPPPPPPAPAPPPPPPQQQSYTAAATGPTSPRPSPFLETHQHHQQPAQQPDHNDSPALSSHPCDEEPSPAQSRYFDASPKVSQSDQPSTSLRLSSLSSVSQQRVKQQLEQFVQHNGLHQGQAHAGEEEEPQQKQQQHQKHAPQRYYDTPPSPMNKSKVPAKSFDHDNAHPFMPSRTSQHPPPTPPPPEQVAPTSPGAASAKPAASPRPSLSSSPRPSSAGAWHDEHIEKVDIPGHLAGATVVCPSVGAFKDVGQKLPALDPATVRTSTEAGHRVVHLKTRINDLHRIRRKYWLKQGAVAGAGLASGLFTMGVGLAMSGAAGVHQRNRLEQLKRAIRGAVEQINVLREHYGSDPNMSVVEASVRIEESVFTKGIKRGELRGDL